MKKSILLVVAAIFASMSVSAQCIDYYTPNLSWSESEYFKIIDIDAEQLTTSGTGLAAFTGLPYGSNVFGALASGTFSSGAFSTPIYNWNGEQYVATNVNWPVNFYMACLAPTYHNSAYTKVMYELGGISGTEGNCTRNNNTFANSPIWAKKGFIELCREPATSNEPNVSRHGYIQINDIPAVERVQWSFSSLAFKRGVKLDIKRGNGNWEPLRWEASNVNQYATFAEQGYQFEEVIGNQEDPTALISLRWRIWDGDSIHQNLASSADPKPTFTSGNTPLAQQQTVRIHQIRIYSGVVPENEPNALKATRENVVNMYVAAGKLMLSEPSEVEIYTVDGKFQRKAAASLQVDMAGMTRGIYLVRATTLNGKVQHTKIVL